MSGKVLIVDDERNMCELLETDLDDMQVTTVQSMSNSARELIELIVSFPEVEWERGREVFASGESSVEAEFLARDGSTTPYYFTGRRLELDVPVLDVEGVRLPERVADPVAPDPLEVTSHVGLGEEREELAQRDHQLVGVVGVLDLDRLEDPAAHQHVAKRPDHGGELGLLAGERVVLDGGPHAVELQ